jgi:hypothetical protein
MESLPEIKVLQQIDLFWCSGLASAMPLLLAGLRKNTSLLVSGCRCAPSSHPQLKKRQMLGLDAGNERLDTEPLSPLLRASKAGLRPYLVACACPGINTH